MRFRGFPIGHHRGTDAIDLFVRTSRHLGDGLQLGANFNWQERDRGQSLHETKREAAADQEPRADYLHESVRGDLRHRCDLKQSFPVEKPRGAILMSGTRLCETREKRATFRCKANDACCVALLVLLILVSCGMPVVALAAGDETAEPARLSGSSLVRGIWAVLEDAKALATAPLRMDRGDALLAGAALAVVGGSFAADKGARTIARHNNTNSSALDAADGFSRFGSPSGILVLNVGAIALGAVHESYRGDSRLKDAGLVSLEAEAFVLAATFALKQITGRARPGTEGGTTTFRPLNGNGGESTSPVREKSTSEFGPFAESGSFPSAHAAASFATAAVFADRFEPPVGWVAYGLAGAVAGSRVYLDEHFVSDVVAGSLIGWGLGKFLSRRHPAAQTEWQIHPMVLQQGAGYALALGKHF